MTLIDKTYVRTGLITANLIDFGENVGKVISGPLCFDEDVVSEDGVWEVRTGEDVGDALERAYLSEYEDWCARKSKEAECAAPVKKSRSFGGAHTPCPALWAGR